MPNNPVIPNGSGMSASGSKHITSMRSVDCCIAVILVTSTDKTTVGPFAVFEIRRGAFARSYPKSNSLCGGIRLLVAPVSRIAGMVW